MSSPNKSPKDDMNSPKPPTTATQQMESNPPKLSGNELVSIINALKTCARDNKPWSSSVGKIFKLLNTVVDIFSLESSLLNVDAPVSICGDFHGQLQDLVRIFDGLGWPPTASYLFLGDYVDRGKYSMEVVMLLFSLRILHGNCVFVLRGNHEVTAINATYGFKADLEKRYPAKMGDESLGFKLWKRFNEVFDHLPISGLVGERILGMHGGLSPALKSLDDIRSIQRPFSIVPDQGLVTDLLWSDPELTIKGFGPNPRQVSVVFGLDVVEQTCARLGLDLIVRGHQVFREGYERFGSRLVTVFSAADYAGEFHNNSAVMQVDDRLRCTFKIFPSKHLPPSDQQPQQRSNENPASYSQGKVSTPSTTKNPKDSRVRVSPNSPNTSP